MDIKEVFAKIKANTGISDEELHIVLEYGSHAITVEGEQYYLRDIAYYVTTAESLASRRFGNDWREKFMSAKVS